MLGSLATGVLTLAGHALFTPSLMLKVIVVALLLALGAAIHDFLVYMGILPFASPELLNIDTGAVYFHIAGLGTLTAVRLPERAFVRVRYEG